MSMRFSEAMLLGLPEIEFRNDYFLREDGDGNCSGCLLGAALYAKGERQTCGAMTKLVRAHWPKLAATPIEAGCPLCLIMARDFLQPGEPDIIAWCTHLADHYRVGTLTAEQIADWIHSFEPEEDEVQPPAPAPVRVPIRTKP